MIARQRVTEQDGIGRIGIERAIAFIGNFNRRKHAPAIERQRLGQGDFPIKAKARVRHGAGLGSTGRYCQPQACPAV